MRWALVVVMVTWCLSCVRSPHQTTSPAKRTPASSGAKASHPFSSHTSREDALHVLRRFTFGARADEVEAATGRLEEWFERQLSLDATDDVSQQLALAPYLWVLGPPRVAQATVKEAKELRRRCRALPDNVSPKVPAQDRQFWDTCMRKELHYDWVASVQMSALARHIGAKAQLREVMVDFWTNHFNVSIRKHRVTFQVADYVERAIRPHALGKFGDLLRATAHHPAMLVYLDNAQSVAANAKGTRGLNENYARELLELHTLGVHGGYSQRDVENVARVLTGFTVDQKTARFRFVSDWHDRGSKHVLGAEFPAGGSKEEGARLLSMLASHASTADFVAEKLVQRFVADEPDAVCVRAVATAYRESDGDIPQMLRALVGCDSFWSAANRRGKIKRPLDVPASEVRVLHGAPDGGNRLARQLAVLGQPLFTMAVPTGYPEQARFWLDARAMGTRMAFAEAILSAKAAGVYLPQDLGLPPAPSVDALVRQVNERILLGEGTETTLAAIREAVAGVEQETKQRKLAVSLALSSAEFQRR